jgi:hypothetical protein
MEVRVGMDEKLQAILWTERPTGALVGTGSLWPINSDIQLTRIMSIQPCPFHSHSPSPAEDCYVHYFTTRNGEIQPG